VSETASAEPADEQAYRLPRTVVPGHYRLRIEPDLAAASFRGTEEVEVEVLEPVDEIVLNAVDLELHDAWLAHSDGRRLAATVRLDLPGERAHLRLDGTAEPGPWTLHVAFEGVLNDKLKGFYRSTYTDEDGTEHVIGTTQFEATDARRAFPCWDEPDLKATFGVTLVVAEDLLAVSNGQVVEETSTGDGRREVRFADTIPMSTYLVAFVVGRLEATGAVDVDGVPLRVVHVPGKAHLTPYALEVGAFCLRWFSEYYDLPYPGDKVDLIALPDFAAGAMENLGAITFREALLLVDPDAVTQAELQRVADVVAHELAHMWFGDLVTMRWWNGLWLNEAFATFMELAAVDAFRPGWNRWVNFSLERSVAFGVDSLATTRPIEYPVHSPADADGMFDVLTYQKGASVLRMLERYLGEEAFRSGIRLYLRRHAHGNAETTDLWDAIEEATGEPVRRIMDSWIFQGGYPVIAVDGHGPTLTLRQRRFRFLDDPEGEAVTWQVPLMATVGDDDRRELLEQPSATLEVGDRSPVVLNAGGHGFYRIRYSPEMLAELSSRALEVLAPIERYLLVDDAWAAVLAGDTPAVDFVDLARRFTDETDRTVWAAVIGSLSALERILSDEPRRRFQSVVRDILGPAFGRLGWEASEGDDELTRQLRATLITALGTVGADPEVQAEARRVHERHVADPGSVEPNVAAAAITLTAHSGGADDFDRFVERARSSESPQEQLRYLYALAAFRQPELADRTLAMTLTPEIRSQNAPFVVLSALQSRDNGERAWRFVKSEWARINERFPDNAISRLLGGITNLATPELATDTEAFLARNPVPQGARTVEQHLERQRVNVALREREADPLSARLTG
jgi:puromycin-sensitive aminopeptidase